MRSRRLQRVRGDVRDKAFNALRQLIDEIDAGRYPGLFLVITGTPAFYDGPSGISRLPPLAQRLATDFSTDAAVRQSAGGPGPAARVRPGRAADRWAARSATCTRPGPIRAGSRRCSRR